MWYRYSRRRLERRPGNQISSTPSSGAERETRDRLLYHGGRGLGGRGRPSFHLRDQVNCGETSSVVIGVLNPSSPGYTLRPVALDSFLFAARYDRWEGRGKVFAICRRVGAGGGLSIALGTRRARDKLVQEWRQGSCMRTSRRSLDCPPLPLKLAPLSVCLGNHLCLELGTCDLWVGGQQDAYMRAETSVTRQLYSHPSLPNTKRLLHASFSSVSQSHMSSSLTRASIACRVVL